MACQCCHFRTLQSLVAICCSMYMIFPILPVSINFRWLDLHLHTPMKSATFKMLKMSLNESIQVRVVFCLCFLQTFALNIFLGMSKLELKAILYCSAWLVFLFVCLYSCSKLVHITHQLLSKNPPKMLVTSSIILYYCAIHILRWRKYFDCL